MKKNMHDKYLLAIVSIVAIVGIIVLVLNAAGNQASSNEWETIELYNENGDLTGQARFSNWCFIKKYIRGETDYDDCFT